MGMAILRSFRTKEEAIAYIDGYKDAHNDSGQKLKCGIYFICERYFKYNHKLNVFAVYLD